MMTGFLKNGVSAIGLAAIGLGASGAALAQNTAATSENPATSAADAEAASGDIVVTAQRRAERLQDVPLAVTALGGADLKEQGARDIQDIARTVPGLVFAPGAFGKGGTPIIRGIASQVGAATVGVYIDDTPIQSRPSQFSGNADPQLFDIDRVEVLRGPQGTLFGASSMGGTIRYIMTEPSFTEFSGRARAEISGQDHGDLNYEAGVAAGGPLSDTIAFRASGFYRRDGGYIDRVNRTTGAIVDQNGNSADTIALRAAIDFRPVEELRIQPAIFYQKTNRDDLGFFNPSLPGISQDFVTPQTGQDRFVLPSLTAEYDFGGATVTSVTSYFDRNDRQRSDYSLLIPNLIFVPFSQGALGEFLPGFENYVAYGDNPLSQKVFTQEVRLTSNDQGRFRWIVGGFYLHSEDRVRQRIVDQSFDPAAQALLGLSANQILGMIGAPALLPGSVVFTTNSLTTETQLAAFGEASYEIVPRLTVTAGVRVSESKLRLNQVQDGPFASGPATASGVQKSTPVNPKFSIDYKPGDDVLLYATAQRGFRVGGVNQAVPTNLCAADIAALGGPPKTTYNSDSLWNYEAGIKSQFADRRVTFNAAAYRIDWNNIQQSLALPRCGFTYTDNLGSARIEGVELETSFRPVDGLSLSARAAYTDAKFSKDALSAPDPSTGLPTVLARSGDRLPDVPRWTYALAAEYETAISSTAEIYARADHQFVGDRFRTLPAGRAGFTPAIFNADSYTVTNARLGVIFDKSLNISAFVTNLFDHRPLVAATTRFSPATQTVRGTTIRPRTIGLTATKEF
jgi:outer membrane receptor protein involved in Fe transport